MFSWSSAITACQRIREAGGVASVRKRWYGWVVVEESPTQFEEYREDRKENWRPDDIVKFDVSWLCNKKNERQGLV